MIWQSRILCINIFVHGIPVFSTLSRLRFLYLSHMDAPLLLFAASYIYSPFRAIAFLFRMVLPGPYEHNWTRETRPINSANPAISEIINKNPNEAKSAVIEAFLCGRCRAIVPLVMHDLIGNVSRIACQLAAALLYSIVELLFLSQNIFFNWLNIFYVNIPKINLVFSFALLIHCNFG